MAHTEPTYVVFDGDKDKWAYAYMRGWKASSRVDFDFRDAHDLDNMTSRAQSEAYVKAQLRERMRQSNNVILIVGESTKNLYKYVRWELELATELGLPIIASNLNDMRSIDYDRCPAILKSACVIHVSFEMKILKYALDNFSTWFRGSNATQRAEGPRHYAEDVYKSLGL